MIACNRHIATSLQTMTLRLQETLMSDSTRPTISIAGDISIVTSPVLLLVLLCAVYKTVVGSCVATPHEFLSSWLPPKQLLKGKQWSNHLVS